MKVRHLSLLAPLAMLFVACSPLMAEQAVKVSLPRPNEAEDNAVSLAGKWKFQFDPGNVGIDQKWFAKAQLGDVITLPGTTDEQGKGEPDRDRSTGQFTRIHAYRGAAWYQVDVSVPERFAGKRLVFSMERTRVTKVWYDGAFVGENNSLVTTQQFVLSESALPGEHTLTVRVHNGKEESPPIGGNHQTSDGTQTNWNGILGKIQVKATDGAWIQGLQVYPDIAQKRARVKVVFGNRDAGRPITGNLRVKAQSWNVEHPHVIAPVVVPVKGVAADGVFEFDLTVGEGMQLWSEFTPAIYRLTVEFEGQSGTTRFADKRETDFGMRQFHTVGTSFAINGDRIFLRGKHDAAVFPQTGYPPMDVDEWVRRFGILKSYGINHIRCHTWCPPEAAFEACDIVGIYLLPELPHWGGVGRPPKAIAGDVEQKTTVYDDTTRYLIKEGHGVLDEFGNHASFVMFELGNELGGVREEIDKIIVKFREYDPRHLYTGGANTFLNEPRLMPGEDYWTTTMTGGTYGAGVYKNSTGLEVRSSYPSSKVGHLNNILKGTDYDYSSGIRNVRVPVISHESGQYQMYPDYNEIKKFTGVTRPYNLETFRSRLKAAGMLDLADDFFKASGALAVICYREDIESGIRTPGFGGFQLLDLQDYPGQGTALVGILDSYLDSKGLITPEKWREFCNSVVPLLRHDSFTWTTDQTFRTKAVIANYGPVGLATSARWTMTGSDGNVVREGVLPHRNAVQGELTNLGEISVDLGSVRAPQKLDVTLSIPGTDYRNSYSIWVYPAKVDTSVPASVKVFNSFNTAAKGELEKGSKVLILPVKEALPTSIDGAFQTDFWCYSMFRKYNPPGTLGILCDPKNPALADFPTEFHSNWQWWRLLKYGRPIDLAALPRDYRPIVQVIDNVTLNRKLGVLFEARVGNGSLLVCSMDLQNQQGNPEGRQMYHNLLKYMSSSSFAPKATLRPADVEKIITAQ